MKKIILLVMIFFGVLSDASVLNGIAIVVNGEPITIAEIDAVQKQLGVSNQEAKDMLIQNRLQKAAMKDITVSAEEIDQRVALIAKQNNLTVKELQGELKKSGQKWEKFRDQIKLSLQKQNFFRNNIAKTMPEPSDVELKMFYKNHQNLFSGVTSVKVTEYSAATAGKIQAFLTNPENEDGIQSKDITFTGNNITPQLLAMISQTNIGDFTPAFNNGSAYVSYRVLEKGEAKVKPFDEVKQNVTFEWKKEQQGEAIDRYFKKMRSEATVEVLRK